jgi:Outer membrane protein beta-barrel domain
MKKLILSAAILALGTISVNAQIKQGAYASINLGYNMPNNANNAYSYADLFQFYNGTDNGTTSTFELVKLSLGKGLNFGGNFGYMFNKNIGAEIGVGYLMGSETEAKKVDNSGSTTGVETTTIKANQLQIKPSLIIAAGYEKINPYAKIGLVLGMGKTLVNYSDVNTSNVEEYELEMKGGMMLGFRASAGLNFAINDKISFFTELTSINGNIKPTEGEYTKYTVDGVNELPSLTYNDTHFEFVDENVDNGTPTPDSVAQKAPRPTFSASSIGLNVGMTFSF